MWSLTLNELGRNPAKIMLLIKTELAITWPEVKSLLATDQPTILRAAKWRVTRFAQQLTDQGASVSVVAEPTNFDSWIRPELSLDKIHCVKCGSVLFRAIPGKTSAEEITAFAKRSTIDPTGEIARTGWIHPGIYCPQGCGFVLLNLVDE